MIRIAATGDLHYQNQSQPVNRAQFARLNEEADIFLLAGDLTQIGETDEIVSLPDDLQVVKIPIVAILGNHDYESNQEMEITKRLVQAGVTVLEGETEEFLIKGQRVGIAGIKGFGHGFEGASGHAFGEPEMKAFVDHAQLQANRLKESLSSLKTDYRFALIHYAPIEATLEGEPKEIYPFLGSHFLAEAIDSYPVDGVFHGHAHRGSKAGATPAGVPVWNVAQSVTGKLYTLLTFDHAQPKEARQARQQRQRKKSTMKTRRPVHVVS